MALASPWKQKAVGSSFGMVADPDEVRRALAVFADPQYGFQLMSLKPFADRTLPGKDIDGLCRAASELPSSIGIYFRVNPVPPTLTKPANDSDAIKRRWVYVDVDPVRAEGFADNPATDAEKIAAGQVADAVVGYLSGLGWPRPVMTDSGNGYGLFWRCELPNDPLVKLACQGLLKHLGAKFDGPAEIDKAVFNAGRLAKLPGTWARKGVEVEGRPFRSCKIVSLPETLELVTWEVLQATVPKEEPKKHHPVVSPVLVNGHGSTPYGKAALEGAVQEVASAPVGERNATLFKKAARLGELAAAGEINKHEAEAALKAAGAAVDPERVDTAATVDRAMAKGALNPKAAPRKNEPRPVFGSKEFAREVLAGEKRLTVALSAVNPLKVEWLVPNRIPKRFVTVLAGRTGVGKSFVSCDLIARMTVGGEIPGASGECFQRGGALIISEDSHEYVLAPRLIAMGADMGRVNAMTWEAMGHYFLGDTDMLETACKEVKGGVSMVLIDPPTNFLDEVDEHKNAEVRQLVMKVVEWCFKNDLACVFVLHVNKQTGKGVEAINRVMGSVAWVTTARVAHSLCGDPDDKTRRLWMPIKNNLGPMGKGLAYRIEGEPAVVNWLGEVDMTADEAMNAEPATRKRAVVAAEWLSEKFGEKVEWSSKELFDEARAIGLGRNAVYGAKDSLKIKARRVASESGDITWMWRLPDGEAQLPGREQD